MPPLPDNKCFVQTKSYHTCPPLPSFAGKHIQLWHETIGVRKRFAQVLQDWSKHCYSKPRKWSTSPSGAIGVHSHFNTVSHWDRRDGEEATVLSLFGREESGLEDGGRRFYVLALWDTCPPFVRHSNSAWGFEGANSFGFCQSAVVIVIPI